MTSPLLELGRIVVEQKPKLIEMTNEYRLLDEAGSEVGRVRQVNQSGMRKALRLLSNVDQFLSHTLAVFDTTGQQVIELRRPAKLLKSTVEVRWGPESVAGSIRQENVVGKKRFALVDGTGATLGMLLAENWRAWDFRIDDTTGTQVARVTKKWAGAVREIFTTADTYVIEIDPSVEGPLRYLCVAAGVAIDTALKQDDG